MRNELVTVDRSGTNIGNALEVFSEPSSGSIREKTELSNIPYTSLLGALAYVSPLMSNEGVREKAKLDYVSESTTSGILFVESWNRAERSFEPTKGLDYISDSITSGILFNKGWLDLFEIEEKIHSGFRQVSETRWVQNLRHPAYYLRQSIPILIEREGGAITAIYDDIDLYATSYSVKEAMSDLCAKIVARYEELRESAAKSQEYTFLKRIIEEVEPPAWQELKQLYQEKLEEVPYVQEGYIRIDGNNAEVVIVLSEESVEIIMELAQIDLEINQTFPSLSFSVEYESSEDYLELDDFECFY